MLRHHTPQRRNHYPHLLLTKPRRRPRYPQRFHPHDLNLRRLGGPRHRHRHYRNRLPRRQGMYLHGLDALTHLDPRHIQKLRHLSRIPGENLDGLRGL